MLSIFIFKCFSSKIFRRMRKVPFTFFFSLTIFDFVFSTDWKNNIEFAFDNSLWNTWTDTKKWPNLFYVSLWQSWCPQVRTAYCLLQICNWLLINDVTQVLAHLWSRSSYFKKVCTHVFSWGNSLVKFANTKTPRNPWETPNEPEESWGTRNFFL